MFRQSQNKYEKILSLKTLANAGLDLSVFELEKIIKNTGLNAPHETIVRAQAIDALRQLRSIMPRKIQKILMPLYKNKQELPELRMSAVAQIMQTQPERAILDQLAQQLTVERSQQVISFVYTLLRTFANSTNPCEKRVAEDLQLALRHARTLPISRLIGKSAFLHFAGYSQKYNIGASLNLGAILSNDSYLPKELMASIDTAFAGQWLKNALQFGLMQQNGEKLIEELLGHQGLLVENTLEQLLTRGRRSSVSSEERDEDKPKTILRSIFKKVGNAIDRLFFFPRGRACPSANIKENSDIYTTNDAKNNKRVVDNFSSASTAAASRTRSRPPCCTCASATRTTPSCPSTPRPCPRPSASCSRTSASTSSTSSASSPRATT